MADEIIQARVWQKVDTEDNWLLNPLILGTGEQAFVWDDSDPHNGVNFKIGDGTKTFAELPYWINYYSNVISHKLIKLENISLAQSLPGIFNSNTNLYDVIISNIGGNDIVFKIGTTEGGSEIGEYNIGGGNTVLDIKYMFNSIETLYLSGFDANALNIIIVYFNYNENPIIPPSGGEAVPFRWPKGFVGMFIPVGTGHLEQCFDMITGMGVVGSKYENCQLCNSSNTLLNLEDTYIIGYKTGQTIGGDVGSNSFTIVLNNLPEHDHATNRTRTDTVGSQYETNRLSSGGGRGLWTGDDIRTGKSGLPNPTPIDKRPKSKYLLYFLAITD